MMVEIWCRCHNHVSIIVPPESDEKFMNLGCFLHMYNAISKVQGNVSSENKIPSDFLLGAATSAFQIEGGWKADGKCVLMFYGIMDIIKGESMWDYYLHRQPDKVEDLTNGDVAADSYHLYEQDVEILKDLGAKSYRFSIAWTRILPNGTSDYVNPLGIVYYRRFIDLLLANDILPLVTIYHCDLPITLSHQGGWLNERIIDWFGEYARLVFLSFGDKVKHWITVNEPYRHCLQCYGHHPLLMKSRGIGFYECGRNHLLAHARAYHIYDTEFREVQGGQVGITLDATWALPATNSVDDAEAVEDYQASRLGQYIDPILKGDYPQRLIDRVAAASARQGYPSSRLRPLSKEQKAYIKGTADFVGMNHYTSEIKYVYRNESVIGMYDVPSFEDDTGFGTFKDPAWPESSFPGLRAYPPGLYSLLMYLKTKYDNPVLFITESGFPMTSSENLDDGEKANYLRNYLHALLEAKEAGSYFWSLLDTSEWQRGLGYKFGLYQVDFNSPNRTRIARKSALVYKKIIRTGKIDFNYNPDPYKHAGAT